MTKATQTRWKIWLEIYHFYQYEIKPSRRHRVVIKRTKRELFELRKTSVHKPPAYLLGMMRK